MLRAKKKTYHIMNEERTSHRERKVTQNHQVEILGRETAGTEEGAETEERGGSMTVGQEGRLEHSRVRKGAIKVPQAHA